MEIKELVLAITGTLVPIVASLVAMLKISQRKIKIAIIVFSLIILALIAAWFIHGCTKNNNGIDRAPNKDSNNNIVVIPDNGANTGGSVVESGYNDNLNLPSWKPYGINRKIENDTVTFDGEVKGSGESGFRCDSLSPNLAGKKIVFEILNKGNSNFPDGEMFSVVADVNKNNEYTEKTLFPLPENHITLTEGYVPQDIQRVEFRIPDDFCGKLSLHFGRSTLKGLCVRMFLE